MTYGEVIDTLKASNRKIQRQLKERAIMDYKLAELIAANVGALMDKEANHPTLVEAYEFLFPKEKKIQEEVKAEREMEIWKQRMIGFAENHNKKWGEIH